MKFPGGKRAQRRGRRRALAKGRAACYLGAMSMNELAAPAARRRSVPVKVGHVEVGGSAPVVVQSMTNTDTADAGATARQVADLARAGSEIVRITVDREEAAAAVPHIKERLLRIGVTVPIVGDF